MSEGPLPKELVDLIDLDSLERTKGSFVDNFFNIIMMRMLQNGACHTNNYTTLI